MSRGKAVINLWDTATTVATTNSITSFAITQGKAMGYCSMLIILSGSSPSVDISMTVGLTSTDIFYTPYDARGTSLGAVYSALTATRWIQFAPALAPYFKITISGTASNGSNTTVKVYLVFEEDL